MNSVGGAQKVVYLVIDGLGKEQPDRYLTSRRNAAFFAEHPHQTITSVFPATTAAAITTGLPTFFDGENMIWPLF